MSATPPTATMQHVLRITEGRWAENFVATVTTKLNSELPTTALFSYDLELEVFVL